MKGRLITAVPTVGASVDTRHLTMQKNLSVLIIFIYIYLYVIIIFYTWIIYCKQMEVCIVIVSHPTVESRMLINRIIPLEDPYDVLITSLVSLILVI